MEASTDSCGNDINEMAIIVTEVARIMVFSLDFTTHESSLEELLNAMQSATSRK